MNTTTRFVTMSTEEEAIQSMVNLRTKTFQDVPIKARIKSESTLRSILANPVATENTKPAAHYAQNPMYGMYGANTGFMPPYPGMAYPGYAPSNVEGAARVQHNNQQPPRRNNNNHRNNRYGNNQSPGNNHGKDTRSNKSTSSSTSSSSGASNNANNARKKEKRTKVEKKTRQPLLNAANFPPLPANAEKLTGAPTKCYAHEDIMEIIKNMSTEECKLVEGKMNCAAHISVLTTAAHADLLKSQRTYSIDQAREAMRQGKPIRSDSVGSIDYDSMLYGEEYTKAARALRNQAASNQAAPIPATPMPVSTPKTTTSPTAPSSGNKGTKTKKIEPQQEPTPKKIGGYAAALLSVPPPSPVQPKAAVIKAQPIKTSAVKATAKAQPTTAVKEQTPAVKTTTSATKVQQVPAVKGQSSAVEAQAPVKAPVAKAQAPTAKAQQTPVVKAQQAPAAPKALKKEEKKTPVTKTTSSAEAVKGTTPPSPWGAKRSFVEVLKAATTATSTEKNSSNVIEGKKE